MPNIKTINVVICVHNGIQYVRSCLYSVLNRTTLPYQLTIVDDGSNRATQEWLLDLAKQNPQIRLVRNEQAQFYTTAANLGIATTDCDYSVLLNSDVIVPKRWLEKLLHPFSLPDLVGIVGPLSNAAGFQSLPYVYGLDGRYCVNVLPTGVKFDNFADSIERHSLRIFPSVEFLNGFCLAISNSVLHKIGMFDAQAFPFGYGEEIDFCLRARHAGFTLKVADDLYIYHAKSKSYGKKRRDQLAAASRTKLREIYGYDFLESNYAELRNNLSLKLIRSHYTELYNKSSMNHNSKIKTK